MNRKGKFCSKCGTPLKESTRFCGECGAAVVDLKIQDKKKPPIKKDI